MNTIQRGITHCDTIGDVFKNPLLHSFVCEWYLIKNNGEALPSRKSKGGGIAFGPKYYEFIRSTFEDRSDMEDFLFHIRERLIKDENLYARLKKDFGTQDIIKVLLSFDDINDQLARVEKLTIQGVFASRIADIVISSQTSPSYYKDIEEQEEEGSPVLPVYYSLEEGLDSGMLPISEKGEILCRVTDGSKGHIVTILGEPRLIEVDQLGNTLNNDEGIIEDKGGELLDTRTKVLKRIHLLQRLISFHSGRIEEISGIEREFYDQSRQEFESQNTGKGSTQNPAIRDRLFCRGLIETKELLEKLLVKMESDADESLREAGKAPIKPKLVEAIQDIPKKVTPKKIDTTEKPKFKIVRNS